MKDRIVRAVVAIELTTFLFLTIWLGANNEIFRLYAVYAGLFIVASLMIYVLVGFFTGAYDDDLDLKPKPPSYINDDADD